MDFEYQEVIFPFFQIKKDNSNWISPSVLRVVFSQFDFWVLLVFVFYEVGFACFCVLSSGFCLFLCFIEWVLLIIFVTVMVFWLNCRSTLGIQEMFSSLLADGCLSLLLKLLFSFAMVIFLSELFFFNHRDLTFYKAWFLLHYLQIGLT